MNYPLLTSTIALLLCLASSQVLAQDNPGGRQRSGGRQSGARQRLPNSDPAQVQKRMLERYRERLELTSEAQWKAVEPLVQKVTEARMTLGTGGRGTMSRSGRSGDNRNRGDQGQRRNPALSNPAAEELQKAIEAKAPAREINAALAKYLESRERKQAALEQAQKDLRAVLTPRQEGLALLAGLL